MPAEVVIIISSDEDCVIVEPPPRSPSRGTLALRRMIRRQKKEAAFRAEKMERKAVRRANKAARPVRACLKDRSNLADVEHSAGSDDEQRVLPNFGSRTLASSAAITDKEAADTLLLLSSGGV